MLTSVLMSKNCNKRQRRVFVEEENTYIKEEYEKTHDFHHIAQKLGRSVKSIKEHYYQYIMSRRKFTESEIQLLIEKYPIFRKKWGLYEQLFKDIKRLVIRDEVNKLIAKGIIQDSMAIPVNINKELNEDVKDLFDESNDGDEIIELFDDFYDELNDAC